MISHANTTARVLLRLPCAERDRLKRIAKTLGSSVQDFATAAVLEAMDLADGRAKLSMQGMVAAVYNKVVVGPNRTLPERVVEAQEALRALGGDKEALRVPGLAESVPDATSDDLIRLALKRE